MANEKVVNIITIKNTVIKIFNSIVQSSLKSLIGQIIMRSISLKDMGRKHSMI